MIGLTPCLPVSRKSSTAPARLPWSVSATAGISNSAARSASRGMRHAPSRIEYSEWTWRWTKGASGTGRAHSRRASRRPRLISSVDEADIQIGQDLAGHRPREGGEGAGDSRDADAGADRRPGPRRGAPPGQGASPDGTDPEGGRNRADARGARGAPQARLGAALPR